MPIREQMRIDLRQAIDNLDGTVSVRRYPFFLSPKRTNNCVVTVIDAIVITPNKSVVEIWEVSSRGGVNKYTTFGGGTLPRSLATESDPVMLYLFNCSRDSGVSLLLTLISYRFNEPLGL